MTIVTSRFYHGTSLANGQRLINLDLTPQLLGSLLPPATTSLDWTEYTDFGKGFYTHNEQDRGLAYEWARRRYPDWAVVEFSLSPVELGPIATNVLHFLHKAHRPSNAPIISSPTYQARPDTMRTVRSSPQCSWLEFVEYNRHIRRGEPLISRPSDRNWTNRYSMIIGPLWVRRDSGYDIGPPPFPDHIQQINMGQAALDALNTPAAKARRHLHTTES